MDFIWRTTLHRVMRRMVLKRRAWGTTLIPPPGDLQDKFRDAEQAQRLDRGEALLQSQRCIHDNPMKIIDKINFERGCKKSCKQMAMQLYCIGLCWRCKQAKKNDSREEAGSLQNFKFKGFQREGKCEAAPIYGRLENTCARTDPY